MKCVQITGQRYDSGFEDRSPYGERLDHPQQRLSDYERPRQVPPVGHHSNYTDIDYERKQAEKVVHAVIIFFRRCIVFVWYT